MGIMDFIKKLLPRFERSAVSEDLRATQKEMEKMVIPSYASAATVFSTIKLESEESKSLQAVYGANMKPARGNLAKNFVLDINNRLKDLLENMQLVASVLDDVVDKDILTAGLTSRSAFVIRAASQMSFMSRYLMSLMNYVYMAESAHRDVEVDEALTISKAEQDYIEKNFHLFTKLFARYSEDPEAFKKMYQTIPEMIVNERTNRMIASMVSAKEVDPMSDVGYAGFVGSPIYTARLAYAQWQNSRYESAKAKKQQLEFRLLYLENQSKGRSDPGLANEIQRLQDRIEKLDYQLSETDKELGI